MYRIELNYLNPPASLNNLNNLNKLHGRKFGLRRLRPRAWTWEHLNNLNNLNTRNKIASGQNLAKSSRAFLIAYKEQPDLAKFCPEAAGKNLAKSSRESLYSFGPSERRGSIWPNFARRLPGKIWPNRAARVYIVSGLQKGAARFGQILPGSLRAKFEIEPRVCGLRAWIWKHLHSLNNSNNLNNLNNLIGPN